jgi:AcrR family transcriptional regulator
VTATSAKPRLPAAERRRALVETALALFAAGSYRGVTTAEIARRAGVSEPILYRHFESKRDLFLACLDEAWCRVRAAWEAMMAEEPPNLWHGGHRPSDLREAREALWDLWVLTITEAPDDTTIRKHLRRHLAEVHEFLAEGLGCAQEAGAVLPERDPDAEAWIFMSTGLMFAIGRRLGGLLEDDLPKIVAARREWMTGAPREPA